MLAFYKPNSKNTGTACSFSVNPRDCSIWSSLIKQSSWNESKKIGSFLENQNNPNKSVKIKFTLTETAGLLDALERNTEFSAYHTSEKQSTQIKLSPYIRDNKQVGFSYIVNKTDKQNSENKQSYLIGFYFNESRLLKQFLEYSLNTVFESQRIEAIKKIKNNKNNYKENEPDAVAEESDLW
jgi:hypothetical protein